MPKCCVMGCGSKYSKNGSQISLHRFPKNEKLKKKWIEILGQKNIDITQKRLFVCSLHFEESYINKTLDMVRLKENAVPTRFPKIRPEQVTMITAPLSDDNSDDGDVCMTHPELILPGTSTMPGPAFLDIDSLRSSPTPESIMPDSSEVVSRTTLDPRSLLKPNVTLQDKFVNASFVAKIQQQNINIVRLRRTIHLLRKKVKRLHEGIRRRDQKIETYSQTIKGLQNSEKTIILLECEGTDDVLKKQFGQSL